MMKYPDLTLLALAVLEAIKDERENTGTQGKERDESKDDAVVSDHCESCPIMRLGS